MSILLFNTSAAPLISLALIFTCRSSTFSLLDLLDIFLFFPLMFGNFSLNNHLNHMYFKVIAYNSDVCILVKTEPAGVCWLLLMMNCSSYACLYILDCVLFFIRVICGSTMQPGWQVGPSRVVLQLILSGAPRSITNPATFKSCKFKPQIHMKASQCVWILNKTLLQTSFQDI